MNYIQSIYKLVLVVVAVIGLNACSDDRDSNPTLQIPSTFTLNEPAYTSGVYDLRNTETILLTCTQPDYGYTAPAIYRVQISLTDEFKDASGDTPATYQTLSSTYSSARVEAVAKEMAVGIVELMGITDEEDFPEEIIPVYVRLQSTLLNGLAPVVSNSVKLPEVLPYFALPELFIPEDLFINSTEMIPVNGHPDLFWAIKYLDAGKVSFTSSTENNDFEEEIEKAGWYLVSVQTEIQGRDFIRTIHFAEPDVYLIGDIVGGWEALEENIFTIPEAKDGEFISKAIPNNDEVRICVILPDKTDGTEIDWWRTEFLIFGGKIEYRGTGDDQDRVSGKAGQRVYLDFTKGEGRFE